MNTTDRATRHFPTRRRARFTAAVTVLVATVACVLFLILRSGSPDNGVQNDPVVEPPSTPVIAEPEPLSPADVDRESLAVTESAPTQAPAADDAAKKRADFLWLTKPYEDPALDDFLRRDFLVTTIENSDLIGVRTWDLTAAEVQELYRRQCEEGLAGRTKNVLRIPFVEDLGPLEMAWLEEKADGLFSAEIGSPELLDAAAAMHALRLAGTYDRMNDLSPVLSLGARLVDEGIRPTDPDSPISEELQEVHRKAAITTLENLDVLGGSLSQLGVQQRLMDPTINPRVRAALLRLYARAGGDAGAQYTIAEAAAGRPAAIEALAEVRSPTSTGELAGLAKRSLESDQPSGVAEAALSALAGIGTTEAYDEFRAFLIPPKDLPLAERSRRMELAARAFTMSASGPLVDITRTLLSFERQAGLLGESDSARLSALTGSRGKNTYPLAGIGMSSTTHDRLCDGLRRAILRGKLGSYERDGAVSTLGGWARETDIPFVLGELNSNPSAAFADNVRRAFQNGQYRWLH